MTFEDDLAQTPPPQMENMPGQDPSGGAVHPEKIIFKGTPSQFVNFNTYTFCVILFLLAMMAPSIWKGSFGLEPQFEQYKNMYMLASKLIFFSAPLIAFRVWIITNCHRYIVSTERIKEEVGVFSKKTDVLELFRVKDITFVEPFALRMYGCGNIVLDTSDKTTPIVVLYAIKDAKNLLDKIRNNVEIMRTRRGVREID